jgi:hypothetical protein
MGLSLSAFACIHTDNHCSSKYCGLVYISYRRRGRHWSITFLQYPVHILPERFSRLIIFTGTYIYTFREKHSMSLITFWFRTSLFHLFLFPVNSFILHHYFCICCYVFAWNLLINIKYFPVCTKFSSNKTVCNKNKYWRLLNVTPCSLAYIIA